MFNYCSVTVLSKQQLLINVLAAGETSGKWIENGFYFDKRDSHMQDRCKGNQCLLSTCKIETCGLSELNMTTHGHEDSKYEFGNIYVTSVSVQA